MKTLPRLAAALGLAATVVLAAPAVASANEEWVSCAQIAAQFDAGTANRVGFTVDEYCGDRKPQSFAVAEITDVRGPGEFVITSNHSGFVYYPDASTAPGTEVQANVKIKRWNSDEVVTTAQVFLFAWADTVEDDAYTVVQDGTVTGDVSDNDKAPFDQWSVVTERPKHGWVDMDQNGHFTYQPAPGFTGTDEFTYQGQIQSSVGQVQAPAKVTITVTEKAAPSSSAPTAKPAADKGKDKLADTGSPVPVIAGAGAGALALGGLGLWTARRRRSA